MPHPPGWRRLQRQLRGELRQLTTLQASDRRWPMPFAAALASGLPLLVGAYFARMDYGLIASLGGLVFLYLPNTVLHQRMVAQMACAFALLACYALGVISHLFPPAMMPVLTFTAILVSMVCRFYQLPPPGSLFFIMAAAIGAYSPGTLWQVPLKVGLLAMGCLLACLIGFGYSLFALRRQPARPTLPLPAATFEFVVFDSVLIGSCVGISLALAQLLQLDNAYWVPVSCLAVMQGMSLRAVWQRQLHRLLGTGVGLLLAWGLLLLPLDAWRISLVMMALTFIIEMAIVRHYGLATVFITPMTLLLAEAATLGQHHASQLIQARLLDTVLGCLVGLLGGICLHSPGVRRWLLPPLRRLFAFRR